MAIAPITPITPKTMPRTKDPLVGELLQCPVRDPLVDELLWCPVLASVIAAHRTRTRTGLVMHITHHLPAVPRQQAVKRVKN
jgi:hypothetical protein